MRELEEESQGMEVKIRISQCFQYYYMKQKTWTCIVAKGQEISAFFSGDLFLDGQVCRYFCTHRISTEKAREYYKTASWRYTKQSS